MKANKEIMIIERGSRRSQKYLLDLPMTSIIRSTSNETLNPVNLTQEQMLESRIDGIKIECERTWDTILKVARENAPKSATKQDWKDFLKEMV